ncbi:hypothetical protein BGZ54_000602 [Gamsiella multidivaricata]|nr:hypothetical protein BGZ54_000602 [Gamsiella multidivaricata]
MDITQGFPIFVSRPLPITNDTTVPVWTPLDAPPNCQRMSAHDAPPQFDCAWTNDGKAFLFGNNIGLAMYDIITGNWDFNPLIFETAGLFVSNLQNQKGLRAAVHSDGYTISVVVTSSPVYMALDSRTKSIQGVDIPGFTQDLHSFCIGVPSGASQPILCRGSVFGVYSANRHQVYSTGSTSPILFTILPVPQD